MAKARVQITTTSTPVHASDVVYRQNADGTIAIMKLDRDDCYFTLDGMAAQSWAMLDGKRSLDSIIAALGSKTPGHKNEIKRELLDLIIELNEEKLLEL